MAGRPRKPIALKMAHGDTRRIGALRHAEEIAAMLHARRGAPPEPEDFEPEDAPETVDPEALARHRWQEKRKARARKHWHYLMGVLGDNGLLCEADQGILAGMAWCYSLMTEAAKGGAVKEMTMLQANYHAASSLTGLNEVTRAKLPKLAAPELSEQDLAMAAGLPPDEDQPIQ